MADAPKPNKSLGQHWLNDELSLETICESADISTDDVVLEIGPGTGALTKHLLVSARKVIAVEFDATLARQLPGRIQNDRLEVIHQDILSFDFTALAQPYKVVANIPYYLTSNLIRVMSETTNPPTRAVLLIQKEVAQRVAAKPGDMSLLSVTAQWYWEVSLGLVVNRDAFTPAPKVDSQVVILDRRRAPLYPGVDPKEFFRLVKAGFSQRRKTLLNSLSAGLHKPKERIISVCASVGIEPTRRAQTLSLDDWHRLYEALSDDSA